MAEPDPRHAAILESISALAARTRLNGFGSKGSLAVAPPEHWSKTAAADDPRFDELRRARNNAYREV